MLNKNNFIAVLILVFSCVTISKAQLLCPLNMGFENGHEGTEIYGWTLGHQSKDNGYKAIITEQYSTQGLASAKIYTDNEKKVDFTATFFQKIDAEFYINKKVRFSADVLLETIIDKMLTTDISDFDRYKYFEEPCYIFINAKERLGRTIAQGTSEKISLIGWNLGQFAEVVIPPHAVEITYGISFSDTSTLYLDNCNLEIISNDENYYTPSSPLTNVEKLFLTAFTNVAGAIQYFHPSKNSIEANWEDVYFAGVNKAKTLNKELEKIKNNDTLLKRISNAVKDFFVPFCPEIKIDYAKNRPSVMPQLIKHNKIFDNNKYLLTYIHYGIPTHKKLINQYGSRSQETTIINLNGQIKNSPGHLMQYITISNGFKPDTAKKINLSAFVKLTNPYPKYNNTIKMYLRYENEMGEFIDFSQVKEFNKVSDDWIKLELEENITEKTTKILVIFEFQGYGGVFIDDVECFTLDADNEITNILLKNSGFELPIPFNQDNWLTTNETFTAGYKISYSEIIKRTGNRAIIIHCDEEVPYFISNDFAMINFDALVLDNGTINCSMPIYVEATAMETINDTLKINNYQTVPYANMPKLVTGKNDNFTMDFRDRDSRLVAAMFLHNYNNHFIENIDTITQYNFPLEEFAICNSKEQYIELIYNVIGREKRNKVWSSQSPDILYSLPFQVDTYNNELYISEVLEKSKSETKIYEGLKINKINKKHWKEYADKDHFLLGQLNDKIEIEVEGNNLPITFSYNILPSYFPQKTIRGWHIINDSILYIDLRHYTDKEINDAFDSLKRFKHWILDLRGDVRMSNLFVSLYADSIYSGSGVLTSFNSAPFKTILQGEPNLNFIPPSKTKQIDGKVVFLINNNTFGYGELLAATIKSQGKGILIGQPTQGAAISAKGFRLDSDIFVSIRDGYGFTPAGTSIYGNPILPDIPANYKPINKITDYILDEAINYIKK